MCKAEELWKQIESYRRRKMTQGEIDEALMEYISSLEKKLDIANVLLNEARKNDACAMSYLSEIMGIVGGNDFPDMIENIRKLKEGT
jgi:hypothetical protein